LPLLFQFNKRSSAEPVALNSFSPGTSFIVPFAAAVEMKKVRAKGSLGLETLKYFVRAWLVVKLISFSLSLAAFSASEVAL
jgi:hypothetical protein